MVVGGPAQELLRLGARLARLAGIVPRVAVRRRSAASCRASRSQSRTRRARRRAQLAMLAMQACMSASLAGGRSPGGSAIRPRPRRRATACRRCRAVNGNTGWTDAMHADAHARPAPCVTESTRNGMSSLTICTTECAASKPSASGRVEHADLGLPGLRWSANSRIARRRAPPSLRRCAGRIRRRHAPVERRVEGLGLRMRRHALAQRGEIGSAGNGDGRCQRPDLVSMGSEGDCSGAACCAGCIQRSPVSLRAITRRWISLVPS